MNHPREVVLDRYAVDHLPLTSHYEIGLGRYVASVPTVGGPDLFLFANLRPSPILRVYLHGAIRQSDTYPRFDRISGGDRSGDAYISFADPTISVDKAVLLGWYVGGWQWDPVTNMGNVVRHAAELVGANEVLVVGGSGGGYAALRLGLTVPAAGVFCFNPQTSLLRYSRPVVRAWFDANFPRGDVLEHVVQSDLARFDVIHAYALAGTIPRVLYSQNLRDPVHIAQHYSPFKRSLGLREADGVEPSFDRIKFLLYDSEREGHGPPYPDEFDLQLQEALSWCFGESSGPEA